jgi:putative acetyltransferase
METAKGTVAINIRHAEPGDYEAVRQVLMGPRAVWGTLQLPFPSAERWRKRLSEPADDLINLLATVEGEVVGQLGLHSYPNRPRRRHAASLGMAVRDDWQGRGVGRALMQATVDLADRWLNLLRLELDVFTDNAPAIALYTKFGFVVEGTHARYAFRDGAYVDSHTMARLRPD